MLSVDMLGVIYARLRQNQPGIAMDGATTLSIMTFSMTTLRIMTCSITINKTRHS